MWQWILGIAAIASIISVALYFVCSTTAVIVSLSFTCLMLLIITGYILYTAHSLIRSHHAREYDTIASFAEFKSSNRVNSTYDIFRLIQCKRSMLDEIRYEFKWTGSNFPVISSSAQETEIPVNVANPNEWDYVNLKLKRPLAYNECTMMHVHTENDDADGRAQPYISLKVEQPIAFIHFRAMLSYKPDGYNQTATFERKKISANVDAGWEFIETVPYDAQHKMYTCMKVRPVPGYKYRLRWIK